MSIAPLPDLLGNLPRSRTPLVGRVAELAAARTPLLDEAVPLLTLTGPGGVGKTRLALAVADDVAPAFANGTVFVDLAPMRDPALVVPEIAAVLGVHETGDRPLLAAIVVFLKPRQTLLLLDNCEHLPSVVLVVDGILAACPAVQVLATSRAPLRCGGRPAAAPQPGLPCPPPRRAGGRGGPLPGIPRPVPRDRPDPRHRRGDRRGGRRRRDRR